jgi:hypothetical protein
MISNSIYVDRRLFPKVEELSILDSASIFDSRLKGSEDEHSIRLDLYSVAWDGTSVLGTDHTYLIGRRPPVNKGATRLRHVLGRNVGAFPYMVVDPENPGVVALIGPSPVPKDYGEDLKLTALSDLLEPTKFDSLSRVTRATLAMMKYVGTYDPSSPGAQTLQVTPTWEIECVTLLGHTPAFFMRGSKQPLTGSSNE